MVERRIVVEALARVEGEGALRARIKDGAVEQVELNIFEPPRFFEGFLPGRDFREAPDITSRICGICPIAYQMSAVHAMEAACGVEVGGPLHDLRRLLYCGEWIESHTLHIHMLHAPDFLGYESAIEMAKDHGEAVLRGLRLKKAGNSIVAAIGGREVHPINVRVGGFYRTPSRREILALREELSWARDAAREAVAWTGTLPFPDFEQDYEFVSLRDGREYPMNLGRIVSNRGLDVSAAQFEDAVEEIHVPHSTALQARIKARGNYLLGPMARYALNFDLFPGDVQNAAKAAGLGAVCRNPFRSITVRAVEVLYAFEEALRLVDNYREPDAPAIAVTPRAARGAWATEAPRGMLYHRYDIEEDGTIRTARIMPPTSQNQPSIEDDLREVMSANLDLDDPALQARCEQTIRNYDPCISCATHFLKLEIERA